MKNTSFEVRADRDRSAFVDLVERRTIVTHTNVERQR
jgi:hypothetical protein